MDIRRAGSSDQAAILHLLVANSLPTAGAVEHLSRFRVAVEEDQLVGVAGIEVYGASALLRSVAVESGARGLGVAAALCRVLLEELRERGIKDVYLRTETARRYFERLGFRRICRTRVDPHVAASAEFHGPRSGQAVTMHLVLGPADGGVDRPFVCARDREPATVCPCPEGRKILASRPS